MTIPNVYRIAEDARERQLRLRREAELHNACRSQLVDRRPWQHQTRRQIGKALIAVGEWLYADERRPTRNPSPPEAHPDHA